MRMMMAQKETIERELAKLQVLLAPYTHTHTHIGDIKREGGVSKQLYSFTGPVIGTG